MYKLRASNTSLEAQVQSRQWLGDPSDELERPFPPNQIFKVHPACPPPHCPDGYWRLAGAPVALAEGNQQRKHQSGFSTPELNQRSGKAEDMEKRATPTHPHQGQCLHNPQTLLHSLTRTDTRAFAHIHRCTHAMYRPHAHTHARTRTHTHFSIHVKTVLKKPQTYPLNPPSPRNDNRDGSRDR